jgi:hypothetical protein
VLDEGRIRPRSRASDTDAAAPADSPAAVVPGDEFPGFPDQGLEDQPADGLPETPPADAGVDELFPSEPSPDELFPTDPGRDLQTPAPGAESGVPGADLNDLFPDEPPQLPSDTSPAPDAAPGMDELDFGDPFGPSSQFRPRAISPQAVRLRRQLNRDPGVELDPAPELPGERSPITDGPVQLGLLVKTLDSPSFQEGRQDGTPDAQQSYLATASYERMAPPSNDANPLRLTQMRTQRSSVPRRVPRATANQGWTPGRMRMATGSGNPRTVENPLRAE